ncbi:MAG: DUF4175 family protein [Ignavibacteria bacterium]
MSSLELTYRSFLTRISEVGKKDILFLALRYTILMLFAFAVLAFLFISLEAIFELSTTLRKIIYFGFISSFAATAVMVILSAINSFSKLSNTASVKRYARKIGGSYPEIKDNLLNAIQLYDYTKRNDHIFSNDLAAETISQVNEKARPLDFKRIITFKKNTSLLIFFVSAFSIFTILMFAFPNTFLAAANRIVNYDFTFVDNTLGIAFDVTPGNVELSKGENLDVTALIKFYDPNYKTDEITFHTKEVTADGIEISENDEKVQASGTNEFKTTIKNINSQTIYWFEYKGVKSSSYIVTITNRPVIKSVKITVYPPAYTKLPSRTVESTEITTIAGSTIYVELDASDDLSRALVQFAGATVPVTMDVTGKTARGSFIASSNGTFTVNVVKDFNGKELSGTNPKQYTVRVFPDQFPNISIIEPDNNEMNVQGKRELLIRARVTDDFGFTKMRLGYKTVSSKFGPTDKDYRYAEIPIKNTDATGLEVPYLWNLSSLNLGSEDVVEYFVEIYDNDGYSGPKVSRSETKRLIYPSLESLMKKTEKSKDEIENSLKSAFDDAMDLKQELDELKEKMEKNPEEMGLNDPKKNQEMQQKMENIQNNLNNTQQKMEDLMKELQQNSQLSKETLDKYMELQNMFQKIDSKELRDALKKLQEAMKNMNKDQLKEAMKNFKFDEENFKKSLEKTMELLNKIMNEQKLGELTQKLDDMTKKQDALKEETKNTEKNDKNSMNDQSKKQEDIKSNMQDFQKQMKELSESMKKNGEQKMSKEMQKMIEDMMKKMLEQKMQQNQENLQQGNKDQSQKKEEELSQDMNQMNQQMQEMLQNMMDQENQQLKKKMQEYLDKLKEMSKRQGELMKESEELDKNSDAKDFQDNKAKQDQLQNDLSNLTEEMMSMAQQMGMSPMMSKNLGDAFNEMQKASDQLSKKDGKNANKSQGNAKESLDKAAEKMQQMCNSGKPGNGKKPGMGLQQLLQQLQDMIGKQQQLNQQMQGMNPNGNEGKLTQEQMAQMQKLATEQQQIKDGVNQLNEEFKKQQESEGKKLLGNLDQVQKDMQEIIKDLQENNVTPETKKRQEKILSRMLDFQLSTREKDFEQKRESRPGKNFDRTSPSEIVISRPSIINGINQDALELQKENYTEDYEVLIQKYLEKIKSVNR